MKRIKKAAMLEKKQSELTSLQSEATLLQDSYITELDKNPKYSLLVDPDNKYNMTDLQKTFIGHYVQFKNITTAAELTGIDNDTAKQFFIAYSSQQEIRRINLALYHRQFANRLMTIDEIGGYLTSLLIGDNVPMADQPHTIGDRLAIVRLLIDLNKLKIDGMQNPDRIMEQNIDVQIKTLSITTIRQLLQSTTKPIDVAFQDNLTPEEVAYLKTLPSSDLLQLIDATNTTKGDL